MEQTNRNNILGTKPILPLIFKLSVPAILSMFIQSLYNVVDSIFVSRLSEDALAALSLAFPIQMVLIAIAVGTGVGTSSLISRLLGQGKEQKASNAGEHVLIIAITYGVIIGIIGFLFSKNIISLFTSDTRLIDLGMRYIRIILIGSLALFIPMIANNILRGEGNTFIPMITMLIGSILNIILDPLLIFGLGPFPSFGIEGAAIATVFSRIISGSFILFMLFNGNNQIKLNFKTFQFDLNIIKGIFKVGLPAMTMQFLASFMISGINAILDQYSATAIAAMGIYFRLQSFVFMPVFGLNQGYMPIIGYNYGHNKPQRMKKAMKYGFLIAFTFTTLGFVIFQLFSVQLIKMFDPSEELINLGKDALTKISLAFPIIGPAIIGSTTFQAIGKGIPSLILSFSRQIILLLPLSYILSRLGGLNYVWYAFPLSEIISGIFMVIWLKSTLSKTFTKMQYDKQN
ncbi:MATE family efflux transporter [Caldisalinibacter kiritimatiensis]|uniref:Multi antimicrobial extrusion protein (Na(+)/drug antiporter) n=1 Tax=Caldisalinibacter kiritimatiensis TaxID=1304284 RepID=R1CC98_9FIRM|nr:MATE family efflux transporter [Caldisalinibacter kiritimatiensis]EOC99924.1 Multi antimicrobial extrusion protein (Na(+)/drug antiporter) [Caldisalinibacter kiritimatiensis]